MFEGCKLQQLLSLASTRKTGWTSWEPVPSSECRGPFIIHTQTEEYWTIGRIILGTNIQFPAFNFVRSSAPDE